jgi:hypothetical protein
MTSQELLKVIRAQPFRPFRVHMGGGRALTVQHPEFVAVAPSGRIAVFFDAGDAAEIVDVFMLQSLEILPSRKSGQSRRRAG